MKKRSLDGREARAVEEALRLYHAWLAYLLMRLGEGTVRVPAEDIRRALEGFTCTVSRDGEDYVIALGKGGEEVENGADK